MADLRDELTDLVALWFRHRPLGRPRTEPLRELPAELADTLTRREPYRSRVSRSARSYLEEPYLAGIGLEIVLPTRLILAPHHDWTCAVHPLRFEVTWSRDMTGTVIDSFHDLWRCVALEDGRWRVVELREPIGG